MTGELDAPAASSTVETPQVSPDRRLGAWLLFVLNTWSYCWVLFWTRVVIVEYCFERSELFLSTVLNTWTYCWVLFWTLGVIVECCFEHVELLLSSFEHVELLLSTVLNTLNYCWVLFWTHGVIVGCCFEHVELLLSTVSKPLHFKVAAFICGGDLNGQDPSSSSSSGSELILATKFISAR